MQKVIGAEGVFAVDPRNGSVRAILNGDSPLLTNFKPLTTDADAHNKHTLEYFIGAGLLVPERRAYERDLVAWYLQCLESEGVHGLGLDELWEDYRRDTFSGVVMTVIASTIVGTSERSEAMFAAMGTRHLQHCFSEGGTVQLDQPRHRDLRSQANLPPGHDGTVGPDHARSYCAATYVDYEDADSPPLGSKFLLVGEDLSDAGRLHQGPAAQSPAIETRC